MAKISYLMELTINDGQLEAFKGKARGFANAVEEDEPGTTGTSGGSARTASTVSFMRPSKIRMRS